MKIRNGFVSNSSSSSFCIVGIDLEPGNILYEILEIDPEKDYYGHGMYNERADGLVVYGDGYEYCSVGLEAEEVLKDRTLPQAYDYIKKFLAEEYNIDDNILKRNPPRLIYGEAGDG
jgi:hypothetical protein